MAGTEMNFWLPSCSIGPSGYWSVLGRLGPGPTCSRDNLTSYIPLQLVKLKLLQPHLGRAATAVGGEMAGVSQLEWPLVLLC